MRSLLFLLLVALGLYVYADRYGLALGYPPFLPVFYWKYTGEARYPVRVTGTYDTLKVKVAGELKEGRLLVGLASGANPPRSPKALSGAFQEEFRYPVEPGEYVLVFRLEGAKGQVRYDWVTTKFAP